MLNFNNDNIFTGQIKQILSSFNLPKYRVYTKEHQKYHDLAVKHNETVADPEKKWPEEKNIIETITKDYDKEHMQYAYYIKDNYIQYCVRTTAIEGGKEYNYKFTWTKVKPFVYEQKLINNTKNLKIMNNLYDSYTHEYLGEYLRFKRDYLNIDLMPLYNCFNDRICNSLNYTTVAFDSSNTNYKIYMIPVHLFKVYTIAIDAPAGAEMCCGIYGKYQNTQEKLSALPELTYKKYNKIIFNQPVIYDLLTDYHKNKLPELAQYESDLKLFIKIPTKNNSSIVILEGDYRNYNDSIFSFISTKWETKSNWETKTNFYVDTKDPTQETVVANPQINDLYLYNKPKDNKLLYSYDGSKWTIISTINANRVEKCTEQPEIKKTDTGKLIVVYANETKTGPAILYKANSILFRTQNTCATNFSTADVNEAGIVQDFSDFKPITALQLLRTNTKTSYPFADRLIEYLLDNCITPEETLVDNIRRLNKVIDLNIVNADPNSKIWNDEKQIFETKPGKLLPNIIDTENAIWVDAIRPIIYEKFNNTIGTNINDINHDIFGYIDKDVEKYYRANSGKFDTKNNIIFTTISSADLYTDVNGLYSDLGEDRTNE